MIEYQIAIPSYQRYEMLKNKTLNTLKKHNINSNLITIFVANQKQFDEYSKGIPKSMYNKLIIGKKGLKNQRNFINSYYPENTYLIQMDDDIDDIEMSDDEDNFENISSDKYLKKDISYNMKCVYNYKFKKWKPLEISNKSIIDKNQILFLEK